MLFLGRRLPYALIFAFTVCFIAFLLSRTNDGYDVIRATAGPHAALVFGFSRLIMTVMIWGAFLFVFAQRLRYCGKTFFWLIAAMVPMANLVVCLAMIFPREKGW